MARYIEGLNECTDPAEGDWLWLVDSSASAADKDRKMNLNKVALQGGVHVVRGHVSSNSWSIDASGSYVDIGNNASMQFSATGVFSGEVLISTDYQGAIAKFTLGGGVVTKMADGHNLFTTTKDTPGKINVYFDGTASPVQYLLQNKLGQQQRFWLCSTVIRKST